MFYRIKLTKHDNGTWLVEAPALPHVHTFGETKDEARAHAVNAILTGLKGKVADKERIPSPRTTKPRSESVAVSALVGAKIELHNAMIAQGIGKYRLGKKLDWHLPQVDRLVDFRYASKLDQIEQALAALGRRLVVSTVSAA